MLSNSAVLLLLYIVQHNQVFFVAVGSTWNHSGETESAAVNRIFFQAKIILVQSNSDNQDRSRGPLFLSYPSGIMVHCRYWLTENSFSIPDGTFKLTSVTN